MPNDVTNSMLVLVWQIGRGQYPLDGLNLMLSPDHFYRRLEKHFDQ
jgi:hypothetical protein